MARGLWRPGDCGDRVTVTPGNCHTVETVEVRRLSRPRDCRGQGTVKARRLSRPRETVEAKGDGRGQGRLSRPRETVEAKGLSRAR